MIDIGLFKNVSQIPGAIAKKYPGKMAMDFDGRMTSYEELEKRSNQIAHAIIAEGLVADNRVALLDLNSDTYFEVLFGATKSRTALAALNNRLAAPELVFALNDSEAKILFVGEPFYDMALQILPECPNVQKVVTLEPGHDTWPSVEDWRSAHPEGDPGLPIDLDDDVIQLYTSGTTGLPKGVQLTHRNYMTVFNHAADIKWCNYDADDNVIACMPQFHVAGVNVGLLSLCQGCNTVLVREILPQPLLSTVVDKKINHAFFVPAVILMLTQIPGVEKSDFSNLKQMFYGASPIAEDLLLHAQKVFGCEFTQVYGLTETTGTATFMDNDAHDPAKGKLRSCGKPSDGVEIRTVDEEGNDVGVGEVGEIIIKSGVIMKGYWRREEATAEAVQDGWFYTGDAGYFDEDGYLFIHDRVKDMIVSGGENIYPAEVENAVFSHPEVADAAVIGIPSERWGEEVKACVVLAPGANTSPAEIIAHCREKIAGYKCPKSVDFITEMPRNPSGKILRRQLREPYWEGIERRVG